MTTPIELSREARQAAAARLRTRDLGPVFYNRALTDARAAVAAKAEDMDEALYGLQRQTELR